MKKTYSILRYCYVLLIMLMFFSNAKSQPFGGFIKFDGVDDELSVSASSLIPSGSDFTIEFWFRTCDDTLLSHQALLGNSNNIEINMFPGSTQTIYQLCANDNSNVWVCHQDHQYSADIQWHHIAVTYSNSLDQFEFYYDGIDGTISSGNNYNFSTSGPFPLYVGRSGYQTWTYNHFNGYMDELRISNTIRYNASFTPNTNEFIPDQNTMGLWHFNESNYISSIRDYSGNNFHFATAGNPIIINSDSLVTQVGNTLTVSNSWDSYQWIKCKDEETILGETNHFFTPSSAGDYAVIVNDSSCPLTLTSSCFNYNYTGLEEYSNDLKIDIYPNPTTGIININKRTNHKIQIQLSNQIGRLIYSTNTTKQSTRIDLNKHSSGIYFIKALNKEQLSIKKIVKH